jgi:hypothetical protein
MKALSIRQPWAWAILHAGKDIENRDWQDTNPGLRFRGPVLIHASAGMTRAEYEDFLETAISAAHSFPPGLILPGFAGLPRGGIIGAARIVDIVRDHPSPWFFGRYGLVLADVEPLPFRPLKGALGFFDVPDGAAQPKGE